MSGAQDRRRGSSRASSGNSSRDWANGWELGHSRFCVIVFEMLFNEKQMFLACRNDLV